MIFKAEIVPLTLSASHARSEAIRLGLKDWLIGMELLDDRTK